MLSGNVLDKEELERAKKLRGREKNFEKAVGFIIKHTLFLTLLCVVTYGNRNTLSFYFFDNIRTVLHYESLNVRHISLSHYRKRSKGQEFQETRNYEDFWNYTSELVESSLFDDSCDSCFGDEMSVRIGVYQMRQIRVEPGNIFCPLVKTEQRSKNIVRVFGEQSRQKAYQPRMLLAIFADENGKPRLQNRFLE